MFCFVGIVLCSGRDPGDFCLSFVLCGCSYIRVRSFWPRDGRRWFPNAKKVSRGSRERRTPSRLMGERSGLESLFRNKCLDAMAMQTMQLQHPNRAAGDVQTGNFGKDWEVVVRIVIEWWRRTEVPRSGCGAQVSGDGARRTR